MDAPHNLSETYMIIRNESVEYLKENYDAIKVESENPIKYPVTLKVKVCVVDLELNLLISLPFNFPDSFPKVKLDEQGFQEVYPLPHLSVYKTLCLFDDVVASPNPDNPKGILKATIDKSQELLSQGLLKTNHSDFSDEIQTYWAEESKELFLTIVVPSEICKEVYLVPFKYGKWPEQGIIADDKNEAYKWVQNIGGTPYKEQITKIIYIPLQEPLKYPLPKNNKDIYNLLKKNSDNLRGFITLLTKHKRPTKVIFSIKEKDSYSWAMWEHAKPFKKVVSNYKGRKRIQTGIKGFRKNRQNGLLELVKEYPMMEIKKHIVEDVSSTRLKNRGGDGKLDNVNTKVALVGCGAVGSHITQGLFDIGIQNLLLVDNDILSFENINRHLCGANQVGQKKTMAVKDKLGKHYPTSRIEVYNIDILSLLLDNPNILNDYDLIIVAISNTPTEIRLNELQRKNIIKKPILNVWVEPYLAGGHGIWLNPSNNIPLKTLFNDNGLYKYQILKDGNLYSKKELGCTTSYVPYGALELKKFIIELIFFIQQQLNSEMQKNKIFTWIGNITEQRRNKRLLGHKWAGVSDFTSRINEVE